MDNFTSQGICSHSNGHCTSKDDTKEAIFSHYSLLLRLRYFKPHWDRNRHCSRCHEPRQNGRLDLRLLNVTRLWSFRLRSHQPFNIKRLQATKKLLFRLSFLQVLGCATRRRNNSRCNDMGLASSFIPFHLLYLKSISFLCWKALFFYLVKLCILMLGVVYKQLREEKLRKNKFCK